MKIVVLNGSPKGKNSVTVQWNKYLDRHYPNHEFIYFNIGQQIRSYEKAEVMDKCVDAMINSDLIIFSYPVYTFIAPYQVAKFIRLLKKHKRVNELKNKYVTQITTSKHFFDTTAHRFIFENCNDMKMKTITGLSADMDDLLTDLGRKQLKDFYKNVLFNMKNDIYEDIQVVEKEAFNFIYKNEVTATPKTEGYSTVIVSDCEDDNDSLRNMIDTFKAKYKYPVKEINIAKFKFSGGCLGCFNCAFNGKCIYKDGFEDMLRNEIQSANVTIYAATVKDHSMGPTFKCYDDRQFCNGHRTVTKGRLVGYILNGDLRNENNLIDIIEGRSHVGETFLCGIATNQSRNNIDTLKSLENLCKSTEFALENKLERPQNFFGVGGMKIFRDLIYTMRGLMKEDHKFYKKNGIYDFPQKQRGTIIKMQLIGTLMAIPSIKKKASKQMNDAIIRPYKKAIEKE